MKRAEFKPCAECRRGVMHEQNPLGLFWRLKAGRMMIDRSAVRRRHGMEEMLGGGTAGATLAEVMGPNDDLAKPVHEPVDLILCEFCLLSGSLSWLGALLFQEVEKAAAPAPEVPAEEERDEP